MADAGFEIEGWDEFVEDFACLIDKWEEKKIILLQRIGTIMEQEIKPLIPSDTSRLEGSFTVSVTGSESVQYSTNVEYALYVNDGHVQHKRFLPIRYLGANGKKMLVSKYGKRRKGKKGGVGGIMLKEKYVAGKHYIENGMTTATPRIETLINSFMEQTMREALGSQM